MKTYKVWIEIEEYDEETFASATMDAPGSSIAQFETYQEAWKFALALEAFQYHAHSLADREAFLSAHMRDNKADLR